MEIKDFISGVIEGIFDGVLQANEKYALEGVELLPPIICPTAQGGDVLNVNGAIRNVQNLKFEVIINVENSKNGGYKLSIQNFEFGKNGDKENNSISNKISFSLKIVPPESNIKMPKNN